MQVACRVQCACLLYVLETCWLQFACLVQCACLGHALKACGCQVGCLMQFACLLHGLKTCWLQVSCLVQCACLSRVCYNLPVAGRLLGAVRMLVACSQNLFPMNSQRDLKSGSENSQVGPDWGEPCLGSSVGSLVALSMDPLRPVWPLANHSLRKDQGQAQCTHGLGFGVGVG